MIKVKIKPNLKIKQNKTRTNQVYFLESRQNWKPKHKKIKERQLMVVVRTRLEKTLAQEPNLFSMPKLKNRSVVWKNATIGTILGIKKWLLTIPPPGGGGPKLRKSIGNTASFPFPLPQFAKISDTSLPIGCQSWEPKQNKMKKRQDMVVVKSKRTLAQEPNLLSMTKVKKEIRSVVWKNATVRTIGLKDWRLTIPTPGGGSYKLKKSIRNKTKKAITTVRKKSDILKVGMLLTKGWHKCKDTLPPIGHVVGGIRPSRGRATGRYCSVLDKSWAEAWNKYAEYNRIKQSQLKEVEAATPHRVISKSKILRSIINTEIIESRVWKRKSVENSRKKYKL